MSATPIWVFSAKLLTNPSTFKGNRGDRVVQIVEVLPHRTGSIQASSYVCVEFERSPVTWCVPVPVRADRRRRGA